MTAPRVRFLFLLMVVAMLSLCPIVQGKSGLIAKKLPSIVFVLIDDLGWADLGCYGSRYYRTPRIDRLASQGMRFTNAYAACCACSPTRASILTGKYPARLHLTDWIPGRTPRGARMRIPNWTPYLSTDEVTIAEVLKSAGYVTAAVGKWHLGSEPYFPEHQGFDLNVAGSNAGSPKSYFYPYGDRPKLPGGKSSEYLTDRLTDEAIGFITENRDTPFFLYLAHYAVHTPLQAKPEVIARYRDQPAVGGQRSPKYAAMCESVDERVGRLLDTLDQFGLTDHTIVILFSDNGGLSRPIATSNAPLRAGKGFPFEGGVRVPLIIRWPGVVSAGSECSATVTSTDFFPTLIDILGLDENPGLQTGCDGVSLQPLLRQSGSLQRKAIFWHYPHYNLIGGYPYGAVRRGDWKLIEFYEDMHVELYNLNEDIGETKDLSSQRPDLVAELRGSLHRWRRQIKAQMPSPRQ